MLAVTYYLIPALMLAQLAACNFVYFNKILAALSLCPADENEKWSYRGRNGPMFWGENFPDCYEKQQSPIDIDTNAAIQDTNLAKLAMINYDTPVTKAKIVNNGHTIQLTPQDDVVRSITIDGSNYTLRQLHFHWGSAYFKGAEHTIDGIQYAMEMHLVHMNENNQIAVVGVIFRELQTANNDMQNIVKALPNLKYKDTETELSGSVNLNNLVPENPASYYRYSGSLTTPGCAEGVTWSVLKKLLTVGKAQMVEFRKLYSAPKNEALPACTLSNNYRPVQPLNDRKVSESQ